MKLAKLYAEGKGTKQDKIVAYSIFKYILTENFVTNIITNLTDGTSFQTYVNENETYIQLKNELSTFDKIMAAIISVKYYHLFINLLLEMFFIYD